MTRTNPGVDLASLARPAAAPLAPPRRRRLALLVPLALVAGFAAVLATSLGDWLGGALEVEVLAADAELARADARAAEAALVRATRELELRTEDELRLAAAEADERVARARVEQARVALETAELALARTTVRAPAAGVVLQRLVAPGAELTEESSAVATLYDPRSVRVRVDVPQGELAKLSVGQAARIEADSRPGRPYTGEVTRLVRQADINKVTLQAHVRVTDGDELLRPEMLVQARFLAAPEVVGRSVAGAGEAPAAATATLLVPAALVRDGSVWVLDALGKRAERRTVRVGAARGADVEVLDGLNLSDKLIASRLEELEPGTRVEPREAH